MTTKRHIKTKAMMQTPANAIPTYFPALLSSPPPPLDVDGVGGEESLEEEPLALVLEPTGRPGDCGGEG